MDEQRCLLVDAFTDEPLSGNAAGVIPDAEGLTDAQMQAIARELAVSETAFVHSSAAADRRIRYFTPTQEVDLCGHATIASHAHLHAEGSIEPGSHTLETNVGVLEIELEADGTVWMDQDRPTIEPIEADYDEFARALGLDRRALTETADYLPIARASSGLPFLMVPVDFLGSLLDIDPAFEAIERLSEEHDAAGIYAFTFDTLDGDSTLHARAFAPGAGVPEDPVTGTASGACGAYLYEVGALETDDETLRFEQGHAIDRGGLVLVQVREDTADPVETIAAGDGGRTVRVGGRAVTALDGTIVVPPDDDDEIIVA